MPRGIPRNARHNPVSVPAPLASEFETKEGQARTMENLSSPSLIERESDHPLDKERIAMLAFMEEMVTIRMASITERNGENVFEITINGRTELFRRGETKTVKRYFVDRLMRLKPTVFGQEMVTNNEGVKSYIYPPHSGLKYDFSIERDDNPLGKSWQRAVLSEAA